MADETKDPIPYERFQEVVQARNNLAVELKTLQDKTIAFETERAEFLKQVGERDAKLKEFESVAQSAQLTAQRLRVAVANGLPLDLADRLQGADEKELQEDAKRVAQYLKPATPGVPPPAGGQPVAPFSLKGKSPAEIREFAKQGFDVQK